MNIEQYKSGAELLEIIKTTKSGIEGLELLKEKRRNKKERTFDDGQYSLFIGEYHDGSGKTKAVLHRYLGNAELLDLIIDTLKKQLEEYEKEFASL